MAKKTKTKKITETLVSQLSEETTQPRVEKEEEVKKAVPKKKKEAPKKKASVNSPKPSSYDSETSGINYNLGGIL